MSRFKVREHRTTTGQTHAVELKVWFSTQTEADNFMRQTIRSAWAGADATLEGSVRGKIATLTGSNAELMGRIAYEFASWKLGRGFATKIQMTGGPS